MIEYIETIKCHQSEKTIIAYLIADAKTDWQEDPLEIVDIPVGYELAMGSYCVTAAGDLGILDSDGVWNWLGDTPEDLAKTIVKELKKTEKG